MPDQPIKRAFIYARISTKQQQQGDGFPRQIEKCREFAAANGWIIVRDPFCETQTGSDEFGERKLLSEAMDLSGGLSATGVQAIIIERTDRIARDLIVSELFFRECRTRKILVYAADSGEELVNAAADPTRILIRQILGALAEWEKSMLIRKLYAGRSRKKLETGNHCGGSPRYSNFDVLKTIADLRDVEAKTFEEIAVILTSRGIPTAKGLPVWRRSAVQYLYQGLRRDRPLPEYKWDARFDVGIAPPREGDGGAEDIKPSLGIIQS